MGGLLWVVLGGFLGLGGFFTSVACFRTLTLRLKIWLTPFQLDVVRQSHWKCNCTQNATYTP